MNFIEDIYSFNEKAGLLENGYDDFLESSFQIEEALEGFSNMHALAEALNREQYNICPTNSPKDIARAIIMTAQSEAYDENGEGTGEPEALSDIDRLDKVIDALIFAVGAMAKLGLTSEQAIEAIKVVTDANLQKLSMP